MSHGSFEGVDDLYRGLVRLVGHLPLFKLTSAFVLPEALNFIGAAGAALVFAIFSFAVSHRRAQPYLASQVIRAPLAKTIAILVAMTATTPVLAFALSPASFGEHLAEPMALAPAFIALVLPSAFCFAVIQHAFHGHRVHVQKLSRLQDKAF